MKKIRNALIVFLSLFSLFFIILFGYSTYQKAESAKSNDLQSIVMGERIALALIYQKNVVLVGENSRGLLISDSPFTPLILPNSGIKLVMGQNLCDFYNGQIEKETVGIIPDIWVDGDSMKAVEALIKQQK